VCAGIIAPCSHRAILGGYRCTFCFFGGGRFFVFLSWGAHCGIDCLICLVFLFYLLFVCVVFLAFLLSPLCSCPLPPESVSFNAQQERSQRGGVASWNAASGTGGQRKK
jgi:hypothetical protein